MVYQHLPTIHAKAIYSPCGSYRYQLILNHGGKKNGGSVCVIMQNPSVAGSEFADKSVQFLEKLIFQKQDPAFKKASQVVIVNQFARIQTRNFKGSPEDEGPENKAHLMEAIRVSDIILIAWGKTNPYKASQRNILQMLATFKDKTVLITKKHPSRGMYENFILPFST